MKLLALEIPEDTTALASWLEEAVVGMHLGDLAAQLGTPEALPPTSSLDELLGDALPSILENGLAACREDLLRELLNNPAALLELQERVFVEGGPYWRGVTTTNSHRDAADRLVSKLTAPEPHKAAVAQQSPAWRRLAFLALAACLLLAVGLWQTSRPKSEGWGFARSGLLEQEVPATEYLALLSDAAGDWFKKRPQGRDEVANRLRAFGNGCDELLAARHPQLAAADRDWLLERCRAWRAEIDDQIARLVSGELVGEEALEKADALIRRLQQALKTRADQAANAVG